MKKLLVIVCLVLICSSAYAAQNPEYGEFYPRLAVVTEKTTNMVTAEDKEGNLWSFYTYINDWQIGDICNLILWNMSVDITKHEVVEVYYEGHTDDIELFYKIMGWRE